MRIYSSGIRPAVPEDSERIGYVHYRAWMETYTGMIPQSFLLSRSAEKSAAIFRKNKCRDVVVAEADGEIVGFCGWGACRETDKDMGEVQGIYVLEAFKRKHFGQKMLNYALENLKDAGYKEIGLWVLEANKNAIGFYERQGFVYSGICKTVMLGEPLLECLYTKKVQSDERI